MLVDILFFIMIFVIFFLVYYFARLMKYGIKKSIKINELQFLIKRYKINLENTNVVKLLRYIALVNAFIISFTSVISFHLLKLSAVILISVTILIIFLQIFIFYIYLFKALINKNFFVKKEKVKTIKPNRKKND